MLPCVQFPFPTTPTRQNNPLKNSGLSRKEEEGREHYRNDNQLVGAYLIRFSLQRDSGSPLAAYVAQGSHCASATSRGSWALFDCTLSKRECQATFSYA